MPRWTLEASKCRVSLRGLPRRLHLRALVTAPAKTSREVKGQTPVAEVAGGLSGLGTKVL